MEPGSDYLNENIKGLYLCFFKSERNGNFAVFIATYAKWACHQPKLLFFLFSLLFFPFVNLEEIYDNRD